MKVKNNYYSGQVLLKKILLSEPDDRCMRQKSSYLLLNGSETKK